MNLSLIFILISTCVIPADSLTPMTEENDKMWFSYIVKILEKSVHNESFDMLLYIRKWNAAIHEQLVGNHTTHMNM